MGKINSKQKGARFERQLAGLLREYGYQARRTAQYCGNTGDASDVVGLPGIHIEAKHQEAMRLYDWVDQAKRDSTGTGNIPVVFHKKNNAEILVTLQFDDFMQIYKEWESAQILKACAEKNMKNQCKKCICMKCINQPVCKRSCELCKTLQGYVSFCVDECRCEQIEMFGKENGVKYEKS